MYSPGWPAADFPNGIIPYVDSLATTFRALGVPTVVVTERSGPSRGDEGPGEVVDLQAVGRRRSVLARGATAVGYRIAPERQRRREFVRAMTNELWRLRSDGVELLEMEESFGWFGPIAAARALPVVVRLHGPWFLNGPANGVARDAAFERRVRREGGGLEQCAAVTAPSHDVLERTREHYGLALPHSCVVPPPVPPVPESQRWRLAACDPDRMLFIGRFDRHKGGDLVIDAFAALAERHPRLRLAFVGPDRGLTLSDGRRVGLEAYVAERIERHSVRARIECLGHQPPARLAALRREAFLTVMASRYEVFGLAALETMAVGCPVVVAAAGGLAEIVDDGRTGVLCPPDSVDGLVEGCSRLLADRDRAERMGRAGAEEAAGRYAPETIARRILGFYAEVLGRTNGTTAA